VGEAGTITITNSIVVAQAGSGGAISGGTIIATGYGIGIAKGGNTTSTTTNENPVIFASAVNGKTSSDLGNGIAIGTDVNINTDNKTITLAKDFTISAGATLTVPPGWTLNCGNNTLTKNGSLIFSDGAKIENEK
jgi:hypothetical protein